MQYIRYAEIAAQRKQEEIKKIESEAKKVQKQPMQNPLQARNVAKNPFGSM